MVSTAAEGLQVITDFLLVVLHKRTSEKSIESYITDSYELSLIYLSLRNLENQA